MLRWLDAFFARDAKELFFFLRGFVVVRAVGVVVFSFGGAGGIARELPLLGGRVVGLA